MATLEALRKQKGKIDEIVRSLEAEREEIKKEFSKLKKEVQLSKKAFKSAKVGEKAQIKTKLKKQTTALRALKAKHTEAQNKLIKAREESEKLKKDLESAAKSASTSESAADMPPTAGLSRSKTGAASGKTSPELKSRADVAKRKSEENFMNKLRRGCGRRRSIMKIGLDSQTGSPKATPARQNQAQDASLPATFPTPNAAPSKHSMVRQAATVSPSGAAAPAVAVTRVATGAAPAMSRKVAGKAASVAAAKAKSPKSGQRITTGWPPERFTFTELILIIKIQKQFRKLLDRARQSLKKRVEEEKRRQSESFMRRIERKRSGGKSRRSRKNVAEKSEPDTASVSQQDERVGEGEKKETTVKASVSRQDGRRTAQVPKPTVKNMKTSASQDEYDDDLLLTSSDDELT